MKNTVAFHIAVREVLKRDPRFAPQIKVLARNKLDSGMTASPAEADGALYLRTKTHLYKITK